MSKEDIEMNSVIPIENDDEIREEDSDIENGEEKVGVYMTALSEIYQRQIKKTKPITGTGTGKEEGKGEGNIGDFIRFGTDKKITRCTDIIFLLIWGTALGFVIYLTLTNPNKIILTHLAYRNSLTIDFIVANSYTRGTPSPVKITFSEKIPSENIGKFIIPAGSSYTNSTNSATGAIIFLFIIPDNSTISFNYEYDITEDQIREVELFYLDGLVYKPYFPKRPSNPSKIDSVAISAEVKKQVEIKVKLLKIIFVRSVLGLPYFNMFMHIHQLIYTMSMILQIRSLLFVSLRFHLQLSDRWLNSYQISYFTHVENHENLSKRLFYIVIKILVNSSLVLLRSKILLKKIN